MCGLFGMTKFNSNYLSKAREALHTLKHRGPDQWGDYYDDHVFIGHQRLSILDLSDKGRQPLISIDGSVVVSVNGEIYNYLTLKKELEPEFMFVSDSDSEVILNGFMAWGIEGLLEKIDGM